MTPHPMRLLQIDWMAFGLLMVLLLTSCLKLTQNFYPELTEKETQYPSVHSCAQCHIDIYEEWKTSPHARAFTSQTYRERTNDYQFQQCLSCHTPDSVFTETILARKERLEEGVSCIACHFIEGKFAGPVESSAILLVHPVEVKTDFYRSSALCGKCHESTYQEWLSVNTPEKKICQECHMTSVVRRSTQGNNLISNIIVSFENPGHFKRHKFHLSEIENLEGGLDIRCSVTQISSQEQQIELILRNQIPHRVPTGSFGERKVVLEIRELDRQGKVLETRSREYFRQMDQGFLPDSTQTELFKTSIQTKQLEIYLKRIAPQETISIASKRIELP